MDFVASSNNLAANMNDSTTCIVTELQPTVPVATPLPAVIPSMCSSASNVETSHSDVLPGTSSKWVPVQEISPLPKRAVQARKRRGNTMKATILTGSPYKKRIQDKMNEKEAKAKEKEEKARKRKDRNSQKKGKKKTSKEQKPKKSQNRNSEKNQKNQTSEREENSDTACLVCGERYTEEWIQCGRCKLWAHEACADVGDPLYYFCDICTDVQPTVTKKRRGRKY